jgi:hypothetical protein
VWYTDSGRFRDLRELPRSGFVQHRIHAAGLYGPWSARGISEKLIQQTTLHWLSPSDPGLTPLKPVRVREYNNVIGNSGKPYIRLNRTNILSINGYLW